MVKILQVIMDDKEFQELNSIKGDLTWREFFAKIYKEQGIPSFPLEKTKNNKKEVVKIENTDGYH